ncbi:hypothetical protein EZV62_009050 [Acer yangbiense]|uniref:Uncharacterized protein n=1 Tax=Acer yangbiense TaxID=1000413 RepID=A0A5C7IFI6_9ROSI|nr:hypothetical protein EZV62_009050 [Acer yangbiense]
MKGRLSNGRLSNVSLTSPDRWSSKGDLSPLDLVGQWSSPESGNPHITRGMKGCIERPRGATLMEARMESQKPGARNVGVPFHVCRIGKAFGSEPRDPLQSPGSSVSGEEWIFV